MVMDSQNRIGKLVFYHRITPAGLFKAIIKGYARASRSFLYIAMQSKSF
jgi:hypothetical protein